MTRGIEVGVCKGWELKTGLRVNLRRCYCKGAISPSRRGPDARKGSFPSPLQDHSALNQLHREVAESK